MMLQSTFLWTRRTVRTMFSEDSKLSATMEESWGGTTIPVSEYRRIIGDQESTDKEIQERLSYLENFFRTIIRIELENYANKT